MRTPLPWLLAAVALAPLFPLGGCGAGREQVAAGGVFANRVIAFAVVNAAATPETAWPYFYQPEAALGEPGQGFDVVSLGYDPDAAGTPGGSITLGLGDPEDATVRSCVTDGEGADLAVFENPFVTTDPVSGAPGTNNEVATVAVSADGETWYLFPPLLDDTKTLADPARYHNLAGVTPTAEGGDRFDLGEVIATFGLGADFPACFVRLTDGGTLYQDFGNTQSDQTYSGADIDAVQALNFTPGDGLSP